MKEVPLEEDCELFNKYLKIMLLAYISDCIKSNYVDLGDCNYLVLFALTFRLVIKKKNLLAFDFQILLTISRVGLHNSLYCTNCICHRKTVAIGYVVCVLGASVCL